VIFIATSVSFLPPGFKTVSPEQSSRTGKMPVPLSEVHGEPRFVFRIPCVVIGGVTAGNAR